MDTLPITTIGTMRRRKKSTKSPSTKGAMSNNNPITEVQPRLGTRTAMIVVFLTVTAVLGLQAGVFWGNVNVATSPSTVVDSTATTDSETTDRWTNFSGFATFSSRYEVLQQMDHDPTSFCQGLQWHQNRLVESAGNYRESLVRIWNPFNETSLGGAKADHETLMDHEYFGEGLCWFADEQGRDRYIQLTWREQKAFVYDTNLTVVHSFDYTTTNNDGWGITFDPVDQLFYVTDGSDTISVWNLQFELQRTMDVQLTTPNQPRSRPIRLLNELEWDPKDRTILAHVWFQNVLVRIHPTTGAVLQVYDFSQLYLDRTPNADVFNGVAHYRDDQWFLTGKHWPHLYLVQLLE